MCWKRALPCAAFLVLILAADGLAGMPTLLPTGWTADSAAPPNGSFPTPAAAERRIQAISFFVACLLGTAWGVKLLWNALRRDLTLPPLSYGKSLGLTVLWGMFFVVVLTMISGARELMTPGAWRKQGWTYTLENQPAERPINARLDRQRGLEELRFRLWQHAASHDGRFPPEDAINKSVWQIPSRPGLKFLYVSGGSVEEAGRLLAFEPATDSGERLVLLSNGIIASMSSSEVVRALKEIEPADLQ